MDNMKIDQNLIAEAEATMRAGLLEAGSTAGFEANAARVIGQRLAKRPMCYLEFGPYWWAVKGCLRMLGVDFGNAHDPMVAGVYNGGSVSATLVAGELFKDSYRAVYFEGNNRFPLEPEGAEYVLEDPDMLNRPASV
jgi:hypothetical protein